MSQNAKTKVLKAFETLIKRKELKKVTVEEVLELSGVSKTTFYRYFTDKFDLACKYFEYIIKPYNDEYLETRDFKSYALKVCELFRDEKHMFRMLYTDPYEQNSVYQYYVNYGINYLEKYINKHKYTMEMKVELHKCLHGNLAVARDVIIGNLDVDFDTAMSYCIDGMPEFVRIILQL